MKTLKERRGTVFTNECFVEDKRLLIALKANV